MAIKKLQNNFTTPEQSKLLLKLGVPADSANCYLTRFGIDEKWEVKVLHNMMYSETRMTNQNFCLPCWSVGRLIEIINICYTSLVEQEYYINMKDCNIDYMVNLFKLAVNSIDFSKLEK